MFEIILTLINILEKLSQFLFTPIGKLDISNLLFQSLSYKTINCLNSLTYIKILNLRHL